MLQMGRPWALRTTRVSAGAIRPRRASSMACASSSGCCAKAACWAARVAALAGWGLAMSETGRVLWAQAPSKAAAARLASRREGRASARGRECGACMGRSPGMFDVSGENTQARRLCLSATRHPLSCQLPTPFPTCLRCAPAAGSARWRRSLPMCCWRWPSRAVWRRARPCSCAAMRWRAGCLPWSGAASVFPGLGGRASMRARRCSRAWDRPPGLARSRCSTVRRAPTMPTPWSPAWCCRCRASRCWTGCSSTPRTGMTWAC